jgi:hypothetical protein
MRRDCASGHDAEQMRDAPPGSYPRAAPSRDEALHSDSISPITLAICGQTEFSATKYSCASMGRIVGWPNNSFN